MNKLGNSSNITATVYDSLEVTLEKYPDANKNIRLLQENSCHVLLNVDGTRLDKVKEIKSRTFDYIVFMFPHVGRGIKDMERNIIANRELIAKFLASSRKFTHPGSEIHITIKQVEPYNSWRIRELAVECGLFCVRSFEFDPSIYPEYTHRRTLGFVEGLSDDKNAEILGKSCRTFCFSTRKPGSASKKRARGDNSDDEDD